MLRHHAPLYLPRMPATMRRNREMMLPYTQTHRENRSGYPPYLQGQPSPEQQPQYGQVQVTTHRHPPERDERHTTTDIIVMEVVVEEVYMGAIDETAVGVAGPGRLPT